MSRSHILFFGFDDQSQGDLNRLKATLTENWQAEIATDIEILKANTNNQPVDVVVSCGNALNSEKLERLIQIEPLQPQAVRILISNSNDKAIMTKAAESFHRIVPPTIETSVFETMLNNSISLHNLLTNDSIRERIASIKSLPSSPDLYKQITSQLASDNATIGSIAELISKDISITTKLLQLVNSAYFGLQQRVETVFKAINMLGIDTVKSIVFAAGVFGQFDDPKIPGYSIESIYNNSMTIAARARLIAQVFDNVNVHPENILMASMMHDVGKLMMLSEFQQEFKDSLNVAQQKNIPLYLAEKEVMGVTDAELGAYLLSLWAIPDQILEAVAFRYTPSQVSAPTVNTLTAVHLAYAITYDEKMNLRTDENSAVDFDYIGKVGLTNHIQNLRMLCPAASA